MTLPKTTVVVLAFSTDCLVSAVVGGVQSHFRVQPNYSIEVVLRCDVVGAVTIHNYCRPTQLSES